jgi:phosphoglycerate dehydrogenase-like enzyme
MRKINCTIALKHTYKFWTIPNSFVKLIKEEFPLVAFDFVSTENELALKLSKAEIFFGWAISRKLLANAKNLAWIQIASTGIDRRLPNDFFTGYKIELTNMKGVGADAVAEFVLGIIIGINRGLFKAATDSYNHIWNRKYYLDIKPATKGLAQTKVGVLGYGAIGRKISFLLKHLNAKISICSRTNWDAEDKDYCFFTLERLDLFLKNLDFLIVALPLNGNTHHIIGDKELALLPQSCFIINIAREELIEEKSLIKAINNKKIKGAWIDVLKQEPPLSTIDYYEEKKILLSPHIASICEHYWDEAIQIFLLNLDRHLCGKNKINILNSF